MSGAGHIARISALVDFLIKHTFLTVVVLGKQHGRYYTPIHENLHVIFLENENSDDKAHNLKLVNSLFEFDYYKLCIIEYINHSYFLKCIPEEVIVVLDAHDIISERNSSFQAHGYSNWDYPLTQEQEQKIYQLYDYVALISEKDYNHSKRWLPMNKLILAPHPVTPVQHPIRECVQTLAFIASDYLPNIDAIVWFLKHVWPHVTAKHNFQLHVYGMVCEKIPSKYRNMDNVVLKGFVRNVSDAYAQTDIIINPVRFGAGLKIKNMEALAHGIPLLTTTHGASGMEDGIGKAFLIADDMDDFIKKLILLATETPLRRQLSKTSRNWITEKFGEDKCFADFKKILTQ